MMRTVNATLRLMGAVAFLALRGGALQASTNGPDAAGYTVTDGVTYSFVDISSTGTGILSGEDDNSAQIALGFSFEFYGHSVSSVCVSTNGLLSFGSCGGIDFANQDLTNNATPGDLPAIAAMWTDLTFAAPGSGAVQYQTMGETGSRRFVAQWTNAYVVRSRTPVTFQAILVEGSNRVLLQYRSVGGASAPAAALGGAATIGIRDSGGESNGRRLQWSYNSPVLADSTALLFAPGIVGGVDITVATNPAGLNVTVDGITYTAPKTFTWPVGSEHTLAAPSPQTGPGATSTFVSWSNGGAQSQAIATPATPATYTANFSALYTLTATANPAVGGHVTGGGTYPAGQTATLRAMANPGFRFHSFAGDLSSTANPATLIMDRPKTVVANFVALRPRLTARIASRRGPDSDRIWRIRVSNHSWGAALNAQIEGVKLTQVHGHACWPAASVKTAMPVTIGDLLPNETGTGDVILDFRGCPHNAKFNVAIGFRANDGAYTDSDTIKNQVP